VVPIQESTCTWNGSDHDEFQVQQNFKIFKPDFKLSLNNHKNLSDLQFKSGIVTRWRKLNSLTVVSRCMQSFVGGMWRMVTSGLLLIVAAPTPCLSSWSIVVVKNLVHKLPKGNILTGPLRSHQSKY
jgi:hypothetical protein